MLRYEDEGKSTCLHKVCISDVDVATFVLVVEQCQRFGVDWGCHSDKITPLHSYAKYGSNADVLSMIVSLAPGSLAIEGSEGTPLSRAKKENTTSSKSTIVHHLEEANKDAAGFVTRFYQVSRGKLPSALFSLPRV